MNNFLWLVLGVLFFFFGFQALITGENIGFAASSMSSAEIQFSKNPIEFVLMTVFQFSVGAWLLISFFK